MTVAILRHRYTLTYLLIVSSDFFILCVCAVADLEILNRGKGGGRQYRPISLVVIYRKCTQSINYIPFIRRNAAYWKKFWANKRAPMQRSPLNPPQFAEKCCPSFAAKSLNLKFSSGKRFKFCTHFIACFSFWGPCPWTLPGSLPFPELPGSTPFRKFMSLPSVN